MELDFISDLRILTMRNYIGIYRGIRFEFQADSDHQAQETARKHFQRSFDRKINNWNIIVILSDSEISKS